MLLHLNSADNDSEFISMAKCRNNCFACVFHKVKPSEIHDIKLRDIATRIHLDRTGKTDQSQRRTFYQFLGFNYDVGKVEC
jgi:hypothetical protein